MSRNNRPLPPVPNTQSAKPVSLPHLSYPRAKYCTIQVYQPPVLPSLNDHIINQINTTIHTNDHDNDMLLVEHNVLNLVKEHKQKQSAVSKQREYKHIQQQHIIEQNINQSISRKHSDTNTIINSPTSNNTASNNEANNNNTVSNNDSNPVNQHSAAVESFIEATGVSDINKISEYLELLHWDLDRSVLLYLSDGANESNIDDAIGKAKALMNK